ncbi:MAG TPA: Rne/Rng family ribonuclease [Terriglobia bacterium]|nr:Rne/Rng family ribonuclease [Terriglobia bacterium]
MNKEMFISSSPHETKVAVCEDGQLVEVYFERDTDVGLVGGIYKGRVNRVLPGMQSAFVDIGLERDAFLYVSDFSLQDQDEFEGVLDESHARRGPIEVEPQATSREDETAAGREKPEETGHAATGSTATSSTAPVEASAVAASAEPSSADSTQTRQSAAEPSGEGKSYRRRSHRGRRHRGRQGRHDDRRPNQQTEPQAEVPKPEPAPEPEGFEVLPGESLAKYRHSAGEKPQAKEAPAHDAVPFGNSQVENPAAEGKRGGHLWNEGEPSKAGSAPPTAPVGNRSSANYDAVEESTMDAKAEAGGASASASRPESRTEEEGNLRAGESASAGPENEHEMETSTASGEYPTPEDGPETKERADGNSEGTGESSEDRSYTLREPHARPRFAPRKGRRGRRRTGRHSPRRNSGPEREPSRSDDHKELKISELLKEGQEIIVQIAKEPLGTKGARITSHVALPGRYVVYMPTINHIGVSRKIASEQERLRLRNIVMEHKGTLTGGFIVRTAGEGHSDEEIKADLQFLTNLWNDIRTRAEQVKAPALLYRDLDLAQRLMRDLVTPDFKSIWLDNEADYERVVEFINRLQPSLVGCAKLHTRPAPLFEEHGIQDEIVKALKPKVWLKSGGYIVINQTEALVAIDVNTGKYVGKTNRLEDTIVKTNTDAVNEIVRQIRLRDLGGIIVIDFIDMDERRNRNKVVQALEEALRRDRAPTKVLSFNDFGLVAVTRKRVKQSLERTLCDPCTYCNGSGWVKSVSTVTYEILAEARKMADEIEGKTITLRVNPDVAHELKSKEGSLVREIETLTHKNLIIKSDPNIHQERFEIF